MNAKPLIRVKHLRNVRQTFERPRITKGEIISILNVLGVNDTENLKTRGLLKLLTTTLRKNVPRKYLGDIWLGIRPDDPTMIAIGRRGQTGKSFSLDIGLLEHLLDYRAKEKEERQARMVLEEEVKISEEKIKKLGELLEKEREWKEDIERKLEKIELSWMEAENENVKLLDEIDWLRQ